MSTSIEEKKNNDETTSKEKEEKTKRKSDSTHNMKGKYATLMEMNDSEIECWYYFIKYEGNEEALKHLQQQLESIEWYMMEDSSTFDLDLEHLVSAQTAKEMTKLELNSYQWHRKFDGKLKQINFKFKKRDNTEKKMCKVCDYLACGQIEEYIDDEDIDSEDLTSSDESSSDSESSKTENESESEGDEENTEVVSEDESKDRNGEKSELKNRKKGIPQSLINSTLPRFAKAKRKYKK